MTRADARGVPGERAGVCRGDRARERDGEGVLSGTEPAAYRAETSGPEGVTRLTTRGRTGRFGPSRPLFFARLAPSVMIRVMLVGLAAIAAVLGFLMDNVWLLGIGGALFAVAILTLIGLAVKRNRRRAEAERHRAAELASRDDELRALGISDIRPKGQGAPRPETHEPVEEDGWNLAVADDFEAELDDDEPTDDFAEPVAEGYEGLDDEEFEEGAVTETPGPARTGRRVEPVPAQSAPDDSAFWRVHSPTAINSYLRALWAATEVQTVALFSTDAQRKTYTLEAALSHSPAVRHEGRFAAADHLASHVSLDRPLTVLEENDPLIRALPHYGRAVHVGGAAVLPVRDHEGAPVFLVADLPPDQTAFTERQRTLLLGYARLLGTMLQQPEDDEANQRTVPTRRSIIADEMARARAASRPLALALVYRADAEAIAEDGPDAVAAAERELRLHLEDHPHEGRIERFGEQMYGVFLHDDAPALEAWADDVRDRADAKGLPLAIGIARLSDRHGDADALRADAANALQEAFAAQEPVVIG